MGRKKREKEKKRREKKNVDVFKILIKSKAFLKTLWSKSDIGRCRCVCKVWRSYLSTPEFKREHLRNNQVKIDDYKLLVFVGNQPLSPNPFRTLSLNETLPPPFDHNGDYRPVTYFKASLDGLVCVAVSWDDESFLVLTNPLTDHSKKLPPMPIRDFSASSDPIGFYFLPANNDYKLVCVSSFGWDGAAIYSLKLNSWEYTDISVPRPHELIIWSPATFYDQCLYFEVSRRMFSVIIRFDVKTETFKEIPVPALSKATGATYRSCAGLVVLNGCLHMYVCYNISDENDGVDVWRMMNYDGCDEWEMVDAFTKGKHQQEEQLLICSTKTSGGNWLAVFDKDDNSFKKMSTEEFTTHYRCFYSNCMMPDRLIYVQTLLDP